MVMATKSLLFWTLFRQLIALDVNDVNLKKDAWCVKAAIDVSFNLIFFYFFLYFKSNERGEDGYFQPSPTRDKSGHRTTYSFGLLGKQRPCCIRRQAACFMQFSVQSTGKWLVQSAPYGCQLVSRFLLDPGRPTCLLGCRVQLSATLPSLLDWIMSRCPPPTELTHRK